jgi:hypothetical protein
MLKRVCLAAGPVLGLAFADAAVALEYCVTCEGPPAMYRCVIDGTQDGPGKDPSVSLYCISEMARKGRHTACAVSRGAPFPCPGLTTVVQQPKNLPAIGAAPPSVESPVPPAASDAPPPEPAETSPPEAEPPAKVPRTVEELAGQTVRSSKEGLQKAGEAIGGTAKKAGEQIGNAGSAIGSAASKTWTCITSLFTSCSGDAQDDETPPGEATN